MPTKRILSLASVFAFVGLVGCGGADESFEQTEQEIFTQPGMETVEVDVMTEDTFMVERTIETEITVDTTRVDGGDVPVGATGTTTTRP